MQPLTDVTPELLVKEQILPPSLMSTAVLPSYFRRGVTELQLPVDDRRAVAAGLARREQRDLAWHTAARRSSTRQAPGSAAGTRAPKPSSRTAGSGSCLAAPGIFWLARAVHRPVLRVLAIAAGKLNQLVRHAGRRLQPAETGARRTSPTSGTTSLGPAAFVGPIVLADASGTSLLASALSLVIAYPAAYFVARFAGQRKGLFLVLLIAPFWISYMMRMLAWIDLLQTNGYVNTVLVPSSD